MLRRMAMQRLRTYAGTYTHAACWISNPSRIPRCSSLQTIFVRRSSHFLALIVPSASPVPSIPLLVEFSSPGKCLPCTYKYKYSSDYRSNKRGNGNSTRASRTISTRDILQVCEQHSAAGGRCSPPNGAMNRFFTQWIADGGCWTVDSGQ